jgi:hypothetical protein
LTAALKQIPAFANAAVPTLNTVAEVAPALQRLGDEATPVVRSLPSLTTELTGYTNEALSPITTMLAPAGGAANLFGEMEGWARSTSGYDASSHIFRFGATIGASTFAQLLKDLSIPGLPPLSRAANKRTVSSGTPISTSTAATRPVATGGGATASAPPAASAAGGAAPAPTLGSSLQNLLSYLLNR